MNIILLTPCLIQHLHARYINRAGILTQSSRLGLILVLSILPSILCLFDEPYLHIQALQYLSALFFLLQHEKNTNYTALLIESQRTSLSMTRQ